VDKEKIMETAREIAGTSFAAKGALSQIEGGISCLQGMIEHGDSNDALAAGMALAVAQQVVSDASREHVEYCMGTFKELGGEG
jgi:hypothetical protein